MTIDGCADKMGPLLNKCFFFLGLFSPRKKVEVFHPYKVGLTVLISLFLGAYFDSRFGRHKFPMELAKLIAPSGPWGKATTCKRRENGGSRGLAENQMSETGKQRRVSVEVYCIFVVELVLVAQKFELRCIFFVNVILHILFNKPCQNNQIYNLHSNFWFGGTLSFICTCPT